MIARLNYQELTEPFLTLLPGYILALLPVNNQTIVTATQEFSRYLSTGLHWVLGV